MEAQKYKRVLIKISGEALAGDKHFGLNFDVIGPVCDVIKKCNEEGCEIGIVVGGGNFWRGVKDGGGKMERTTWACWQPPSTHWLCRMHWSSAAWTFACRPLSR